MLLSDEDMRACCRRERLRCESLSRVDKIRYAAQRQTLRRAAMFAERRNVILRVTRCAQQRHKIAQEVMPQRRCFRGAHVDALKRRDAAQFRDAALRCALRHARSPVARDAARRTRHARVCRAPMLFCRLRVLPLAVTLCCRESRCRASRLR